MPRTFEKKKVFISGCDIKGGKWEASCRKAKGKWWEKEIWRLARFWKVRFDFNYALPVNCSEVPCGYENCLFIFILKLQVFSYARVMKKFWPFSLPFCKFLSVAVHNEIVNEINCKKQQVMRSSVSVVEHRKYLKETINTKKKTKKESLAWPEREKSANLFWKIMQTFQYTKKLNLVILHLFSRVLLKTWHVKSGDSILESSHLLLDEFFLK